MQQQELCRSCRTSLPDDRETCPRCGRVRETVAAAWTVAPPRPEETMTGPRPEPAVRPAAGRRPNGSAPAAVAAGGPAEEGWQALPVDPQDPEEVSPVAREVQLRHRFGPSGLPRFRWDDAMDWGEDRPYPGGDELPGAAAGVAARGAAAPATPAGRAAGGDAGAPRRRRRRGRALLVVLVVGVLGYLAVRATDVLLQCRADGLPLTGSRVERPLQAPPGVRALRRNDSALLSRYVEQERRRLAVQGFDNVDGALYGPSEAGGSAFVVLMMRAGDDQRRRFLEEAGATFTTLAGATTPTFTTRLDGVDYRCIRSRGGQYNDVCSWDDGDTAGYGFSDTFGIERLSAVTAGARQETVRFSRTLERARPSCVSRLRWSELLPG